MDNFKGAEIDLDEAGKSKFDASQYSFFVMDGSDEEELGGALEEGLDAPPEEESLEDFDEEHTTLSSAIDSKLGLRESAPDEVDGCLEASTTGWTRDHGLKDAASPNAVSSFPGMDQSLPAEAAAPSSHSLGSVSNRTELPSQAQLFQSMAPSSGPSTLPPGPPGPSQPPMPTPPGFLFPHGANQLHGGSNRLMRAMTAEELEAQMIGNAPEPSFPPPSSSVSLALTAAELESRMLSQQQQQQQPFSSPMPFPGIASLPMPSHDMLRLPQDSAFPGSAPCAGLQHANGVAFSAGLAQPQGAGPPQPSVVNRLFPGGPQPLSPSGPQIAGGFPYPTSPHAAGGHSHTPLTPGLPPSPHPGFPGQAQPGVPPHMPFTPPSHSSAAPFSQSFPSLGRPSPYPEAQAPGASSPFPRGASPLNMPPLQSHLPATPQQLGPPGVPPLDMARLPRGAHHSLSQPLSASHPGGMGLPLNHTIRPSHLAAPNADLSLPAHFPLPHTPFGPHPPMGPPLSAPTPHPPMGPHTPLGPHPLMGPPPPGALGSQTSLGPHTPHNPPPSGHQLNPMGLSPHLGPPHSVNTPRRFPPGMPPPGTPPNMFGPGHGQPPMHFPPGTRPDSGPPGRLSPHQLEGTRQHLGGYAPRMGDGRPGMMGHPHGPHGAHPHGPHGHPEDGGMAHSGPGWRRRVCAQRMSADEIEHILRIQHQATHQGEPYVEDYYFQAFVNKRTGGRNAHMFAPEVLREFSLNGDTDKNQVRHLNLEGLGKIVLSNIKTPKLLMDISDVSKDKENQQGANSEGSLVKPLEKEPLLAARMMIEDCMQLLLDVDDVDRTLTASRVGREDLAELRHRRTLLVEAIVSSFRLPATPWPSASASNQDGILLRITSLAKGRIMIARTLRVLHPPPVHPHHQASANGKRALPSRPPNGNPLLWAVLRNAYNIFGTSVSRAEPAAAVALMDANAKLAAALVQIVKRIDNPQHLCAHMHAFVSGSQSGIEAAGGATNPGTALLPISPSLPPGTPAASPSDWLGSVLAVLLSTASSAGLLDPNDNTLYIEEGGEEAKPVAWKSTLAGLVDLVVAHVGTLSQVYQGAAQGGSAADASRFVRSMLPYDLVHVLLLVLRGSGKEGQLQELLSQLPKTDA